LRDDNGLGRPSRTGDTVSVQVVRIISNGELMT